MAHISPPANGGDGKPRALELSNILRAYGGDYRRESLLFGDQRKVMRDITVCRTPELGGHIDECQAGCGYKAVFYNSCRNRHCPKCQAVASARWLAGRMERILPTHYFHVAVTLPGELGPLSLRNKRVIYNLLFKAGSQALLQLAQGYERLKAKVGFTAVLHTWNQELGHHPHLHIVVTGGGMDAGGNKWNAAPNSFLVPVKALSKIVRGKFLELLHKEYRLGKLRFGGAISGLADEAEFLRLIKKLRRKKWVVYSKAPFGGPEQVYSYISRYTHRVAIANSRLVGCQNGKVTFKARDNENPGKHRMVCLDATEFIRRFLQHVLPRGFVRIRHYGLMAPKNVNTKLVAAKRLILQTQGMAAPRQTDQGETKQPVSKPWREVLAQLTGIDLATCPKCKKGKLIRRAMSKGDILLCYEATPMAA
jgi:hypothetical protein